VKRFLRLDNFPEHLELHRLDCISSHGRLDYYELMKRKMEELPAAVLKPAPLITGEDLIAAGYQPGPPFARILEERAPALSFLAALLLIRFSLNSTWLVLGVVPSLSAVVYKSKPPKSFQWNAGMQLAVPWEISLDVEYVGQHSWNTNQTVDINAVDFGAAFLTDNQDATQTASATPGATALPQDLLRAFRGYGTINQQWDRGWRTYHSIQWSLQRRFRNGLSFGFNDTMGVSDHQNAGARLQHNADGTYSLRSDQADADKLLGNATPRAHIMKANFVWDLPDLRRSQTVLKAVGLVINDWQLSGIWTGSTGDTYTVSASYSSGGSNTNLTGSPNYGARVRIVGDPGRGCNPNDVYRQFNTAAFQGPLTGSVGLDSDNNYLRGCMSSVLDLSVARNIRIGKGRVMQLRADIFNAPNEGRITDRQRTMNLSTPLDPVTISNLPFDPVTGAVAANRVRPNQAGFGAVSSYQAPRTVQGQVRFSF
jgi:hypothetical protein